MTLLKTIIYCLMAVIFLPVTGHGADSSLLYILDGSGSMWGRVSGQPKISIAKQVMSELVRGMPDELQAGLIVYGHRRKGDCSDIEELIPLGALDRNQALQTIEKISPKGRTPISDSIQKAADILHKEQKNSTIVLVSDGLETYGKDPCALTRSLKASGAKFTLHVVGFGIKKSDVEQLSCIAHAGGGNFYQSRSASELLSVLNNLQQSVAARQPIKPESQIVESSAPANVVKQKSSGKSTSIRIKAQSPGRIVFKYYDWLKKPYYWKLLDPETGSEKGRFTGLGETLLAPGDYQLLWRQWEHHSKDALLAGC